MARFLRASLLPMLGVAALAVPTASAAATGNGGATPESAPTGSVDAGANGGAAPGERPAPAATSARTGGAVPGRKPHRRAAKRHGRRETPRQPPSTPAQPTVAGVFPLPADAYSFGGEDARFGAPRTGHTHQGQDVIAARGTPIAAPLDGSILWKANQPAGAGIYLVLHGGDGRDYVFMHIKRGTVLVKVGDLIRAGQQLAQVGATGDADGPHLHFEIWVGGWYVKGGRPVDPLPQLERWAGVAPGSASTSAAG